MLDMNPDIRAQWCAALRSGDYQQTKEALYRGANDTVAGRFSQGYCCLGVLTDLWLKAGHSEMVDDPDDETAEMSVWDNTSGTLSLPVAQWAGLGSYDPELRPGSANEASILNDFGATFAEIADLIDGAAS